MIKNLSQRCKNVIFGLKLEENYDKSRKPLQRISARQNTAKGTRNH